MANLFLVWNIKEKRVEGIFESNNDALSAKRRISAKSGTRRADGVNAGKDGLAAADVEILTCTKP